MIESMDYKELFQLATIESLQMFWQSCMSMVWGSVAFACVIFARYGPDKQTGTSVPGPAADPLKK